jgi:RNA polymerase sigma-70 factor (ECF subfamily)
MIAKTCDRTSYRIPSDDLKQIADSTTFFRRARLVIIINESWLSCCLEYVMSTPERSQGDQEESSERGLLQGIAAGDPAALTQLMRDYSSLLYSYVRRKVPDRNEAEDIIQEVLLKVWRHSESFDASRHTLRAWLFALTRNACLDHMRAKSRHRQKLTNLTDEYIAHLTEGTQSHLPERVDAALATLPEQDRQLALLKYNQGLSLRQIAERLGLSAASVSRRLARITEHLADRLKEKSVHKATNTDPAHEQPTPEAEAKTDRLVLRAYLSEYAPEDEVVEELVNLYRALNAYDIACGGSGLVIDDWQLFVRQHEPAEVM